MNDQTQNVNEENQTQVTAEETPIPETENQNVVPFQVADSKETTEEQPATTTDEEPTITNVESEPITSNDTTTTNVETETITDKEAVQTEKVEPKKKRKPATKKAIKKPTQDKPELTQKEKRAEAKKELVSKTKLVIESISQTVEDGKHTINSVADDFFIKYLIGERGVNEGSLYTYFSDYKRIQHYYDGDKLISEITIQSVNAFAKSPSVTTKNMMKDGTPCSDPTIQKTLRLMKMWLEWLLQTGRIEKSVIPRGLRMGGKSVQEKVDADKEKKAKAKAADKLKADQAKEASKTKTVKAKKTKSKAKTNSKKASK